MYAPAYGYGPNNSASASASAPYNPNAAPPQQQQPHNPHHPQQHQQQHQQQPGQQPQQMMYNPQQQQYAGPAGVGSHQSPYGASGPGGPGMGGNAGAMGMMQNTGMAQMAGGHVPAYQTPYSSSPYGGSIPTSTASNLPPNFMPTTSGAPSFAMNAPNMNPQHQAQRMQPPPTTSTPTQPGPRASPFAGVPHTTPPNAGPQSQFSTPQAPNQSHLQTPNNSQQAQAQAQAGTILTPQTPNFPPGSQNANALATPLSPGSELREKERVTVLLDINLLLLKEAMVIQQAQAEAKKEEKKDDANSASPEATEAEKAEKEKAEKTKPPSREYFECMRRLQSNLAYLAAIADRSHKPLSQIPPHPAVMSAPPLPSKANSTTSTPKADYKKEDSDEKKTEEGEEDRAEALREQYRKLQALFPGVDPKKETAMLHSHPAVRQQQAAQQVKAQQQQQMVAALGGDQKMQNDMMRQKMMQQQAQQRAQMAASQGQNQMGQQPQQQQQGQ